MTVRKFNNPLQLLLVMLVATGLMGAWNYAGSMPGIDYYVFWVTVDATRQEAPHNIYDSKGQFRLGRQYSQIALQEHPGTRRAMAGEHVTYLPATGTPFLYWVVSVFSTGDFERDLTIWSALTLLGIAVAVLWFGRLLGLSWSLTLLMLLASLVWMEAIRSELRVGNVNGVQLGLLTLCCWLLRQDQRTLFVFLGGAATAMTVMFKPNLGPVVILVNGAWMLRGDISKWLTGTAGMAAGTILAFLVSAWFFGRFDIWLDWFQNLFGTMQTPMGSQGGNLAARNELADTLGPTGQVVVMVGWCLLALALFWWGRRNTRNVPDSLDRISLETTQLLALGCVIQMTISSLVWLHYYVLLLPMLLVALRPWSDGSRRGWGSVLLHRVVPVFAFVLLLDSPLIGFFDVSMMEWLQTTTTIVIVSLLAVGLWQLAFPDPVIRREGEGSG